MKHLRGKVYGLKPRKRKGRSLNYSEKMTLLSELRVQSRSMMSYVLPYIDMIYEIKYCDRDDIGGLIPNESDSAVIKDRFHTIEIEQDTHKA